jgi:hypothetical protein
MTMTMLLMMGGCGSEDSAAKQELVDFAKQMVSEQQAANRSLQSQSEQLSTAAKELVASDALARAELISAGSQLHEGISQERHEVNRMRDELVSEQRAIASQRNRDPMVAAAIQHVGIAMVCIMPLAVCWLVIRGAHDAPVTRETTELLLLELSGQTNRFGPRRPRFFPPVIFRSRPQNLSHTGETNDIDNSN